MLKDWPRITRLKKKSKKYSGTTTEPNDLFFVMPTSALMRALDWHITVRQKKR
jgi:hypothetical protein